jgi:hypothetical protein
MEQKVLVGTNTGLSLLVKSRNQSYSITALNESELEYTLTLSFEGSVNLRFVPKRTDVQTLNPTNFKVVVPGYQSKKVISAGAVDTNEATDLAYRSLLFTRCCRLCPMRVGRKKLEIRIDWCSHYASNAHYCLSKPFRGLGLWHVGRRVVCGFAICVV